MLKCIYDYIATLSMVIDTHSHLSFKAYDKDRDEVIKRTQKQGIICIDVGTKYETSERVVELAKKYEGIYAAIGMHPFHIKTDLIKLKLDPEEGAFAPLGEEFDKEKYKKLAESKKVVAIGEIGLDYYYKPKIPMAEPSRTLDKIGAKIKLEQFKEKQKQVFLQQLDLARELNLPVILHCRMAQQNLIEILKSKIKNQKSKINGVVHCFTGTLEDEKNYLDLGLYLGFNGIIFKIDPHAKPGQDSRVGGGLKTAGSGVGVNLDEVIKKCPIESMLVETDCPYLTPPQEDKNTRNEPIFVKHVIQRIAELKEVSFEQVANQTTQNAKVLFKLP
ncbi:MAG: TatD family hydrolase [bacterium]